VFIDEIDVISPKRETAQREMERRIVAQLLSSMDSLQAEGAVGDGAEAEPTSIDNNNNNNNDDIDDDNDNDINNNGSDNNGSSNNNDGSEVEGERKIVRPARPLVLVIGATNRPDALDAALRRAGRFDREIAVPIPSLAARRAILELYAQRLRLAPGLDLDMLAQRTPGYVGADLQALTREAAVAAVNRIFGALDDDDDDGDGNDDDDDDDDDKANHQGPTNDADVQPAQSMELTNDNGTSVDASSGDVSLLARRVRSSAKLRRHTQPLTREQLAPLAITMPDFVEALGRVQPSAQREGFAVIPDVTWSDVGALTDVRAELEMALVRPIAHPERFAALGIAAPAGVLLYGPPGCGKVRSLLACALPRLLTRFRR
jgi:ribosome biogenesis ATPase